MSDEFEELRRRRLAEINAAPKGRDALQALCGTGAVYDTQEFAATFEVVGYLSPFVVVKGKADGVVGSMEFQHEPRLYFNFVPDEPRVTTSCSFCHASNPLTEQLCHACGHEAHVARMLCRCARCTGREPPKPITAEDVEAALEWLRRRGRSE